MDNFLPVLLWGLAVLAALAGWGRLLARQSHAAADWLEAPAWGIALSSFIGSLLNLGGLATRISVVVFVLAGCALAGCSLISPLKKMPHPVTWRRKARDWPWLGWLALPLGALALRFAGSVLIKTFFPYAAWAGHSYFNPQDDSMSYLVSPERMLQTGTIGADPFNSRQLMSALGAQHFLNAMALALFAPDNVHIIEGGVGLAAACLAAAGLGVRLQLGRTGAALLMLVPLIFRPWYVNISSTTTTVAVLLALCSALVQLYGPTTPRRPWLLRAGLLLGAACSLKSTTIPTAVVLVAGSAGLGALAEKKWRPLGLGLLVALAGVAVMLPWMWWQYHSAGTPLYPLLGRGFQVEVFFPSVPAPFHGDAVQALKTGLILPCIILAGLLLAWSRPAVRAAAGGPVACVTLAIVGGWLIAWPLIAMATEYNNVERYLAAAQMTALTMALACVWHAGLKLGGPPSGRWARHAGPVLLAALLLGHAKELYMTYGQIVPHDLANSLEGQANDWTEWAGLVHSVQVNVPAGAKILAYTDEPYLFDFNRNPIYVADWPGESSPPSGLPVHQGGEAVAAYLLKQNIRYIIYAYKTQANYPRAIYRFNLDPSMGRVMNQETALSFAFQDDLAELAQSRTHRFDDGFFYVLDLASPAPPKPPAGGL